jgi:HEPN domain-containing protein
MQKELKGYLVHKGWLLKKTHNLAELVDEAIEYEAAFDTYLNLAHQLTAYYFETRYPPGAPKEYSEEEIDNLMRAGWEANHNDKREPRWLVNRQTVGGRLATQT